jgi:hypothetical protein
MESRVRAYHLFTIPAISSKMPNHNKAEYRIQFYWSGLIARKKVSQSDSRRPKLPNPRKRQQDNQQPAFSVSGIPLLSAESPTNYDPPPSLLALSHMDGQPRRC